MKLKRSRWRHLISQYDILFVLATQTYLRLSSKDTVVLKIQELLERRLAFLNFLYCSGYQMLLIFFYFLAHDLLAKEPAKKNPGNIHPDFLLNMGIVVTGGILLLYCSYRFNRRISRREMWAIKFCEKTESEPLPPIPPQKVWSIFNYNITSKE